MAVPCSRALLVLVPLLSISAWATRPVETPANPEKQVLNLVASGHVQVARHQPGKQPLAANLAQLAETVHHIAPKAETAAGEVAAVENEIVDGLPDKKEMVLIDEARKGADGKKCEGVTDVLFELLTQDRKLEVFFMIGGTVAFLIALVCVSIYIGMGLKPPPPRYWNNGAHFCCSFNNDFDEEFDVTTELLPVVQKLFDMTTASHALGVGVDAAWQTHKKFKVTKVVRIESGRHWTQYATALNVTQPYEKCLDQMPAELRKDTQERWQAVRDDHLERENDPLVGPFLKSLGLDSSRNETMLFHGSPLAGARNRSGEVIFPTEAQAPMNAIKKTGFDERLGNAKGMVGAGTYFGDHVAKADSYAGRYHEWPDGKDPGSVGEKAAMFLARVAVGCPYVTKQSLEQLRRPPCLQGHFDANLCGAEVQFGLPYPKKGVELEVCEHARFDAVIAEPPMTDNHPWATEFREFVLYEKRCYPEFLIYYERHDENSDASVTNS